MLYDFVAPRHIIFGWGRREQLGELCRGVGRRAFLIAGSRTLVGRGEVARMVRGLAENDVETRPLGTFSREPLVEDVDAISSLVGDMGVRDGDFVLAVGGGSAIDLGKAVAAMATNHESPTVTDYLEGVGRGLVLRRSPLPIVAVPTTAGTGSEATCNAVVSSLAPPFKKSLRNPLLLPRLVLVDPEITTSLPRSVTVSTGMDCLTQLIESYISKRAAPLPRALAIDGLRRAVKALPEAAGDGTCRWAREQMAHAALESGMALANSGLGMAHGVAAAMGVHCGVSHGLACAMMLPAALAANRHVAEASLASLAAAISDDPPKEATEAADLFVSSILRLCDDLGVPRKLSEVGVKAGHVSALVRDARGNSMRGNPREVSDAELHAILESML